MPVRMRMSTSNSKDWGFLYKKKEKENDFIQMYRVVTQTREGIATSPWLTNFEVLKPCSWS